MAFLPPNHPERLILADEVHARPPEPLETPTRATYVAVLIGQEERASERTHIASLCERFGIAPPASGVTQFSAALGNRPDALRIKWERHGEFSGYTFFANGQSATPFSEPVAGMLPNGWLAGLPGVTIVAAHAKLIAAGSAWPDQLQLAEYFGGNIVVGAEIADGAGAAYTDFRIHTDGCSRFVILDRGLTQRQAGRMMQRLFEIEAYRMLALLALPIARRQSPRIETIERALAALTDNIARDGGNDESLLHELTRLAAEVESGLAASQFRFDACRAYHQLVLTRISELRERNLPGMQTVEEFMARRLTPAVATCSTTSQRLHNLSERVSQASSLLSTRVDITRERQNQALLASMDRRAQLQLRLQQTVEGLSVAAIVYYVAGLIGYLAKAVKAAGLHIDPELAVGAAIPAVAILVMSAVHRARQRIHKAEAKAQSQSKDLAH